MSITVVDVSQLTATDSAFVDIPCIDSQKVEWRRHSGLPQNSFERAVTKPNIARYRASLAAAKDASGATALISHMPWTTAMVSHLGRLFPDCAPHLAMSFNFTLLPSGQARRRWHNRLRNVEQFTVYTEYEADRYAEAFDLPRERFQQLDWTQRKPPTGHVDSALLPDKPFFAAVGGEGRDFSILIEAARSLPEIEFVVIARPSPDLSDPPPNMRVVFNIPEATCWGIASRAIAVLIPLKTEQTCCGHITLVSARLLGLPMLTTRSFGTREYSEGYAGTVLIDPADSDGWKSALLDAATNSAGLRDAAATERAQATIRHDRARWAHYVENFIRLAASTR